MLVFNLSAAAVLAAAIGAFAAAEYGGYSPWRLVVGFVVMTVLGAALEAKPAWRPRYFWVIPAWVTGVVGTGAALIDIGEATIGYVILGVGSAIVVVLAAIAILRKPGGKWLAGLIGAGSIVAAFQLLGYYRPEWKHPVLYVVNALALVGVIACGVMLHRARSQRSELRENRVGVVDAAANSRRRR